MNQTHNDAVLPAPAGMSRCLSAAGWPVSGAPRASGDEPFALFSVRECHECSPRQRG